MTEYINKELDYARYIVDYTGTNLFLTGKAGTGKTTFLRELHENSSKSMVILAPTGIAAINAGGVTIHSFFQLSFMPFIPGVNGKSRDIFKISKQKKKIIRSLDLIVIDEMSMVRADLLDNIDSVLRIIRKSEKPFGGVQLLMIGDLQQLAPVVKDEEWELLRQHYKTPYFFSSKALKNSGYITIELKRIYRQSDQHFISLLNKIRDGNVSDDVVNELNSHYKPNFAPDDNSGYIRLVTHNWQANIINEQRISQIQNLEYCYSAVIDGNFPESSYPTDSKLTLKKGAQVMFVKNNQDKGYFNGMIGHVTKISNDGFKVKPISAPDTEIIVPREIWKNTKYSLNEKSGSIEEKVEGQFLQFPVRLAWAITIHKSQGLTFEHAIIDAHSAFTHGQVYVALSRCKTLEGIVLSSSLTKDSIICDKAIQDYCNYASERQVDRGKLEKLGFEFFINQACNAFDFYEIERLMFLFNQIVRSNFIKSYPEFSQKWSEACIDFKQDVTEVASKFQKQLIDIAQKLGSCQHSTTFQERITKASDYFLDKLIPIAERLKSISLPTDNKEVQRHSTEIIEELRSVLHISIGLMKYLLLNGFSLDSFMKERSRLIAISPDRQSRAGMAASGKHHTRGHEENTAISDDVRHPELYRILQRWRYETSKAKSVPAYVVLQQRALVGIANALPFTKNELMKTPSFGEITYNKYGGEILSMVHNYRNTIGMANPPEEPTEKHIKKISSKETSLSLFKSGNSIKDIAQLRNLTESTIFGHLISFLPTGQIKIEQLVPEDIIEAVKNFTLSHDADGNGQEPTLTQIREGLGEKIGFNEIRAVLRSMKAAKPEEKSGKGCDDKRN